VEDLKRDFTERVRNPVGLGIMMQYARDDINFCSSWREEEGSGGGKSSLMDANFGGKIKTFNKCDTRSVHVTSGPRVSPGGCGK